ncbi:pectinacetylesterase family protein [Hydrocarboniclastica marina]|nr:pectinacetylesterase family protein [Hydrocarboniclastica marina]
MKLSSLNRLFYLSLLLALPVMAQAEIGDYGTFKTLRNLISPPSADHPVTPADRQGDYPLISNPDGFEDGFKPGKYRAWQTVQLAPETGAVCGNGSEYKFFVNRVPNTTNTMVYFQGGGACWDYPSCTGQTGIRGAANPNGIPDDYMTLANPSSTLMSPFIVRLHPWSRVKTQNWNMVFVPYCTGDIFSGDKVAVYEDETGENEPLVWHHNGIRNTRAVVAWLRDNMPQPGQMLSTGCSAGGVGSFTNYYPLRNDLAPKRGYLINDSGPIFDAPRDGDASEYPSAPLHTKIHDAWGLDGANGPLEYLDEHVPGVELDNLGSLYAALATHFPGDRMGHTHFWKDLNYSAYSYERFHEDTANAPDQETLEAQLHQRWEKDTTRLTQTLSGLDNFGYYLPQFRDINESHCTSIIEFANADIQEQGLDLEDFINNVLNGSGSVMQASESSPEADYNKPFNPLYWALGGVL